MLSFDWKKIAEAIGKLTATSAIITIVGVLLYRDTVLNVQRNANGARLEAIEKQHLEMQDHAQREEDLTGRTYMATERVFAVLQAMCRNQARTELAVARCEDAGLQILRRGAGGGDGQ